MFEIVQESLIVVLKSKLFLNITKDNSKINIMLHEKFFNLLLNRSNLGLQLRAFIDRHGGSNNGAGHTTSPAKCYTIENKKM